MILFEGIDNFNKLFTRENYFNYKGRVGRREFWSTFLVVTLIGIASSIAFSQVLPGLHFVIGAVIAIPFVCLEIRRLHDAGHSGFLILWDLIIGLAGLVMLGISFCISGFFFSGTAGVIAFLLMMIAFALFLADFVLDIVILIFLMLGTATADKTAVKAIEQKGEAVKKEAAKSKKDE